MLGLFGTLELGSSSLQNQRQAIEVTGQNIANADNPAYARQRLQVQTAPAIQTAFGQQGTGATAVSITSIRDSLLDDHIRSELSITSYLEAQQQTLQSVQAGLGQTVNRQSDGSSVSVSNEHAISARLNDLFNGFQAVSAAPGSMPERQSLVMSAVQLADRLNQTDQRLAGIETGINTSLQESVTSANTLLQDIAKLNQQILRAEGGNASPANDLRDLRLEKLESLAKIAQADVTNDGAGSLNVSIGGVVMVSGKDVLDSLETYDAGGGRLLIQSQATAAPLNITAGTIAGNINVRDGELASLRTNLNNLAGTLITEVNALHRTGFNQAGRTGADFFTGTNAADIAVNPDLVADPSRLQASGQAGASANNQVALAMARLAETAQAGLSNQTFSDYYGQAVGELGHALSGANAQLDEQTRVQSMLTTQRDSVSGVSLDEEMTNLMKFQKAFQASAKLISVVEEMLESVLNMKS